MGWVEDNDKAMDDERRRSSCVEGIQERKQAIVFAVFYDRDIPQKAGLCMERMACLPMYVSYCVIDYKDSIRFTMSPILHTAYCIL